MAKNTELVISIESRKGGVGKTTAALCLARLLLKRNYSVLVLDLDITGTNAADFAESPFWKNDLHVIKGKIPERQGTFSFGPVNLLTLFDQFFMNGKSLPEFSTQDAPDKDMLVDLKKINVLGSQIYRTDNNSNKNVATCIERPGILFDDLHTLWLLEFIKRLIHNFSFLTKNRNRTAIILDNSPGYVGIAPAIHEWLTDSGPECGKFLTVMSIDEQDLRACELAIQALHSLYVNKWQTSRNFIDAGKAGAEIDIEEAQKIFFMRLATALKSDNEAADPLLFYRRQAKPKTVGQIFIDHPEKYIAAVLNRVPRAIKAGHLAYKFPAVLSGRNILSQLLNVNERKAGWHERMISLDEYIENQFLLHSLYRGRSESRVRSLIDILEMAKRELHQINHGNENYSISLVEINNEQQYKQLSTQIATAHDIVNRALSAVDNAGFGHLARLIHEEWLPGNIIRDFRSAFMRFLRESKLPHFEMMPFELEYDSINSAGRDFEQRFKQSILMELKHYPMSKKMMADEKTREMLSGLLSTLVIMSVTPMFWHKL